MHLKCQRKYWKCLWRIIFFLCRRVRLELQREHIRIDDGHWFECIRQQYQFSRLQRDNYWRSTSRRWFKQRFRRIKSRQRVRRIYERCLHWGLRSQLHRRIIWRFSFTSVFGNLRHNQRYRPGGFDPKINFRQLVSHQSCVFIALVDSFFLIKFVLTQLLNAQAVLHDLLVLKAPTSVSCCCSPLDNVSCLTSDATYHCRCMAALST